MSPQYLVARSKTGRGYLPDWWSSACYGSSGPRETDYSVVSLGPAVSSVEGARVGARVQLPVEARQHPQAVCGAAPLGRDELRVREAILDGEVVALHARDGRTSTVSSHGVGIFIAAFDVLWFNGKNLRGLPLTRRKRALERVIPATSKVLSSVYAVEERGRDLFAAAERLDLEGIVAKRKADSYAQIRCGTRSGTRVHADGGTSRATLS
jgi:hypothetical protein